MRSLYLALAVIGAVVPILLTVKFLGQHGADGDELVRQILGSPAAAAVFFDVIISSLAFWAWLAGEGPRVGVRRWPFVVANLLVGLSFALPLFLYVRSGRLDRSA